MGGSQLKQLKTRLQDAGLSRSKGDAHSGKKVKSATPEAKAAKLEAIKEAFNRYDVKHVKQKFDVGGRKTAGVNGRPAQSKSAGLESRRKTLLPELLDRNRTGGIVDRRFGESNPSLTPEERALERFTRERQRKAGKASLFNLEDDAASLGLTHLGQSLASNDAPVAPDHSESDAARDEGRPKSKAEVMKEVIAKSKAYKADRQRAQEEDEDVRLELDKEMDDLRGLLGSTSRSFKGKERQTDAAEDGIDRELLAQLIGDGEEDGVEAAGPADSYDRFVKELAFEPRVEKASDRLKTDEEKAELAKRNLEAAEKARLKRMRGEEIEESNSKRRAPEADDLGDDFQADDEDNYGLGGGLGIDEPIAYSIDADGQAHLTGKLFGGEAGASSEDEEEESEDGSEEEHSAEDNGREDDGGLDVEGLLSDGDEATAEAEDAAAPLVQPSAKALGKRKAVDEIAFTFECPETHQDLLEILETAGQQASAVGTVVQRIRTQYHPKLGNDNKQRMETFLGILFDHVLFVTAQKMPDMAVVDALVPHIFALCTSCPLAAYQHCVARLKLMHKNLVRGLQQGPLSADAKTWPGLPELTFLRLVGLIWSTSDQSHPVSAPAQLLMDQYLAQARIRTTSDVAAGLFLVSLCLQYESQAKRFCPEAVNFVASSLLLLLPHSLTPETLPGAFPAIDAFRPELQSLRLSAKNEGGPSTLTSLLHKQVAEPSPGLATITLRLLTQMAEMYASLEAFPELFGPIAAILEGVRISDLPASVKPAVDAARANIERMLKLAKQTRRPLRMQQHRAIAIASHTPKFDDGGSGSKRSFDPDQQRVEASKLRALHRKERKGAVRELRKDARFLADEKAKMQRAKDDAYRQKIGKITSGLSMERGEQNRDERDRKRRKRK